MAGVGESCAGERGAGELRTGEEEHEGKERVERDWKSCGVCNLHDGLYDTNVAWMPDNGRIPPAEIGRAHV